MKRMQKLLSFALVIVLMLALSVTALADGVGTGQEQLDRLREIDMLLTELYLYGVDSYPLPDSLAAELEANPKLYDEITKKMFDGLDTHSHYMDAKTYAESFPIGVPYVGIGIVMDDSVPVGVYIASLVEGGPAELAGLKPGDLIVEVNGQDIRDFSWEAASSVLRGDEGSEAKLKVMREGEPGLLEFTVIRKGMSLPNVTSQNLGDGVGYIRIERFGSIWDVADFQQAYNDLPYEGVRSLIIDLRGNPGGSVEVCANMLYAFFTDKDVPMFQLEYASYEPEKYLSYGSNFWKPNAVYILMDETSASSSEIFAGVLQAKGLATTIGVNTYGKARAQYHIELDDASVVIITASRITVNGLPDYQDKGITPNKIVELEKVPYPIPELAPLSLTTGVFSTSTTRTLALEQRLSALGYFYGQPDTVFDSYTRYALQNFQRASKLSVTNYAGIDTLTALEAAIAKLSTQYVYEDTQLETAFELAKESAIKPLAKELPKRDFSR